ncbi:putative transmembrane protein [Stenotrophomonas maltophilia]
MLLRGTPLLIALLLHLLVALLYWALIPLGMNWYRDQFGFASHRDIGLGIAQFYLFWMFIGAQPLIAVLRLLFARLLVLAIPLAFASWTLMHNHPLRLVYFTVGPGLLALAAIVISAWYASPNRLPAAMDTAHA